MRLYPFETPYEQHPKQQHGKPMFHFFHIDRPNLDGFFTLTQANMGFKTRGFVVCVKKKPHAGLGFGKRAFKASNTANGKTKSQTNITPTFM